ncbi:MAG: hypothetical protein ABI333_05985 [bacterium]
MRPAKPNSFWSRELAATATTVLLFVALTLAPALALTACDDDQPVGPICGNGVIDPGEACDGTDLGGLSCTDLFQYGGTLACSPSCELDLSSCVCCAPCGNDIADDGEECDGPDLAGATCESLGWDAGTLTCTEDCLRDETDCAYCGVCGDNLQCGSERCDGNDLGGATCEDLGYARGILSCASNCLFDETGCLGPCVQHEDCCWYEMCDTANGGVCELLGCSNPNDLCSAPGGTVGWCLANSEPPWPTPGICLGGGALSHGDICPAQPGDCAPTPRCEYGICMSEPGALDGRCSQGCNWEQAYAVSIYGGPPATELVPCPTGSNCFSGEKFDSANCTLRPVFTYCRDDEVTDPTGGMTTCSLVTNQLLGDSTQTCVDTHGLGARCVMMQLSGGDMTNGSLVGVCLASTAPTLAAWDFCDPSNAADICPSGSVCTNDDLFATTPVGPERCVPYCDTDHPDGVQLPCEALGAVPTGSATPTCQSQSYLYCGNPVNPTRLGFCAVP